MWRKLEVSRFAALASLALSATIGRVPDALAADATRDPKTADALFERGKARLAAGDWSGACADFEASMALDPSMSTQVKIARCREHDGRLEEALAEYRRALELNRTANASPERKQELRVMIEAAILSLEARLAGPGETGTPTANAAEPSGNAGQAPTTSGSSFAHNDPGAKANARARTNAEPSSPGEPGGTPGSTQRAVAIGVGAGGIVTLGIAGYFGLRTHSLVVESRDHCYDTGDCEPEGMRLLERADKAQTTALVLTGVGAAALGAGVALYFTAPKRRAGEAALRIDPYALFGPARIAIGARY